MMLSKRSLLTPGGETIDSRKCKHYLSRCFEEDICVEIELHQKLHHMRRPNWQTMQITVTSLHIIPYVYDTSPICQFLHTLPVLI
jgi:hypothetical protein